MSLRWRLALALALLAFAATALSALFAYAATGDRLSAQVDSSLQKAARQLAGPLRLAGVAGPGGLLPGPVTSNRGANPPGTANSGSGGLGLGAPSQGIGRVGGGFPIISPTGPGALFDLVVIQHLSPGGGIAEPAGLALPVDAKDRQIAAGKGAESIRTETVSGSPFRIITEPLPTGGAVQLAESLGQNNGVLGGLRWRFTLLATAVTLLAATLGWLIARRITGPLEKLTGAAEDVAAGGGLERSLETNAGDEVGRLGRAFAAMLAALQRSKNQQQRLVRDAGHELRTPITSLRSNIDLLRRHHGNLAPADMGHLLGDLDSELRELTLLVDEVVAAATDTKDPEELTTVRMDDLVAKVGKRAQARSGRSVRVQAEQWSIEGQARSLERAITNLVENAVKFSPPDSPIEIDAPRGKVVVRDRGPGISDVDLPHVFDRFHRATSARSQSGSGLGLAIVRQIAESHGGSAQAQNRPDGGADVSIFLPFP